MTVKVLIERRVEQGKEGGLIELLNRLRVEIISQLGYISGELLQSMENKSTILAFST